MLGNPDGKKIFRIPVEWVVAENIPVQADSLEEAKQWVENNLDEIPIDYTGEADFVGDSYRISEIEYEDWELNTNPEDAE